MQSSAQIKQILLKQLPILLRKEPEIRNTLEKILSDTFASKRKTEDRFERLLAEIKQLRQESEKRWKESDERWKALKKESDERWKKSDERWEALKKESEEKWELLIRKYDTGIGGLGARWGIQTEEAFRNGLKGIIEMDFKVQAEHVIEYDHEGTVFGWPSEIELDLIIRNGIMTVAEIKSAVDQNDVYAFMRKANFYEKLRGMTFKRRVMITPYIYPKAQKVAVQLGVEVYSSETLKI